MSGPTDRRRATAMRRGATLAALATLMALAGCGGGGGGGTTGAPPAPPPAPSAPTPPPPAPNNAAPVLSSGTMASAWVGATGTVYTARAADADGQSVTYAISGRDAALFTIDATSGALRFKTAPAAANAYELTVTASDGSQSDSRELSVVVAADTGTRPMRWTNARWGGGGYVSGIEFHPAVQGLAYARTDVGGLYRRDPGSTTWVPLNDHFGRDDADSQGIASVALDPNDGNKVVIATGMYLPDWGRAATIFRSSDRGRTWQRTPLTLKMGGNSDGRGTGERLVVDPHLGSVLLLGTFQDGLYRSSDGGASWAPVPGFAPRATTFVVFDRSSGRAGAPTPVGYAGVATTSGPSLYRSTDAGTTWSAVPGGPGGLMPLQGTLAGDGQLYLSYGNGLGPNGVTDGAVWKLDTRTLTWRNITPSVPNPAGIAFGYGGIAVSASHPQLVVVATLDRWAIGDDVYRSTDGGLTWTALAARSTRTAPRHAWITASEGGTLANGRLGHWMTDVAIDPFDDGHAMFNTGGGIWETTNLKATALDWLPGVDGLEETCITSLVSPRKGAQVLATMGDVGGIRYGSNDFSDNSGHFPSHVSGLSVDVAELEPDVVVYASYRSWNQGGAYLSRDNGITWAAMAARPAGTAQDDNGLIAISAKATSMVWVPAGARAFHSADGGRSWHASGGYPLAGAGFSADFPRPVADRAVDGAFYTYDVAEGRLLESTDGGKTFSATASGLDKLPPWAAQHRLLSVPGGKRRDLWLATPTGLRHFDGPGAAPVKVAGVDLAVAVGYGAPAPGQAYPALFLAGSVNGLYGLWRSDDKAASWVRISDATHQFGAVNWITGDARQFGRVYLGTGCRGVMVGDR
ncbi:hypothetical protein [Aquabacterium humicola]|uniref:hypothetical protein n=1 Tax=Aquabacterium humicola TaxID=3237377 RepID=UPI00254358A7|nr:hypothetical protein [Rubrivivax pictus]